MNAAISFVDGLQLFLLALALLALMLLPTGVVHVREEHTRMQSLFDIDETGDDQ